MDDPTRRCENDTGNGTRLLGPPIPSGGPIFFECPVFLPALCGVRQFPLRGSNSQLA